MATTIAAICDAIQTTLAAATGIQSTQSYDELKESLNRPDLPCLQIYWQALAIDPRGRTDRSAFRGGLRTKPIVIHVDLYAATRGPGIGQENAVVVACVDALIDVIEEQDTKPYFGLEEIQAFSVDSITRVVHEYTDAARYLGARFVFTITVF